MYHRGGGNKKLYRIIDYKRSLFDIPAIVKKLEYDPNRTSRIAPVPYKNGMVSYMLSPKDLALGDRVVSPGKNVELTVGNAAPLGLMPTGTFVHGIELRAGGGGKLMRAAGSNAKIIATPRNRTVSSGTTNSTRHTKRRANVIIRLHSGRLHSIESRSMATIGIVPNDSHGSGRMRKAGEARWRNKRPVVRGVAMNPVDHPHGGGEGRSKGGRHPVTP